MCEIEFLSRRCMPQEMIIMVPKQTLAEKQMSLFHLLVVPSCAFVCKEQSSQSYVGFSLPKEGPHILLIEDGSFYHQF